MIPLLQRRAQLVLATSLAFVGAGAVVRAPVLLALGAAVLIALVVLYVCFLPAAIYLRRKKIDVAWYVKQQGSLAAETQVPVELTIRNHGFRLLYVRGIRPVTAAGLQIEDIEESAVPAGHQVVIHSELRMRAFGRWCVHGCELYFRDPLDLFVIHAYFPSFLELRADAPRGVMASRQRAPAHSAIGYQTTHSRRAGQGDDIHELREYKPGDPFKAISWKASARHRQLITREMESSHNLSHVFLLDVGAAMRDGPLGETQLDAAVAALWGRATHLLSEGHRIGVVTFDTHPHWHLPLGATARWRTALRHMLGELPHLTDVTATDAQSAYVVEFVAQYLLEQTGHSFAVIAPPTLDVARWTNLHIGTDGSFYDLGRMLQYLGTTGMPQPSTQPWRSLAPTDPEPAIATLREFCSWRCLPLPPLRAPAMGIRSLALTNALKIAAAERPGQISVLSSGDRLLEAPGQIRQQLGALAKRSIAVHAPLHPASVPAAYADDVGQAAWEILSRQRAASVAAARDTWRTLGLRG